MERKLFFKLQQDQKVTAHTRYSALLQLCLLLVPLVLVCSALAAGATDYEASQVDSPPRIVRALPATYPILAKQNGVEGHVVIRCLINTRGRAEQMQVVESVPKGVFDQSALRTLKYWQFRPGILKGKLVNTWVRIPFAFKLH